MVRWAEEFREVYPGVNFDISAGAPSEMVDIGMVF